MAPQTLTIGKRRFVLITERDYLRLQKQAATAATTQVRPDVTEDAIAQLRAYRKSRKAAPWTDVKRRLGL